MNNAQKIESRYPRIERYVWALVVIWTIVAVGSLAWNLYHTKQMTLEEARLQARISCAKDILYRHWNSKHGGIYVPVTEDTPPNPYLSHIPERDIRTVSGKLLTLMGHDYMTRQVYDMEEKKYDVHAHRIGLKPIRPENAPDPWETKALKALERGQTEISSVEKVEGKEYLRLMRPFISEKSCVKCHAEQGKEGKIYGGISVSIPMGPVWITMYAHILKFILSHSLLWVLGLGGIVLGTQRLRRSDLNRRRAEEEREKLIQELREALSKVKTLSGLLPICASCKKIRGDKGYWTEIEIYVRDHSEAAFSHGLCPDCKKKLYPDL